VILALGVVSLMNSVALLPKIQNSNSGGKQLLRAVIVATQSKS
jgi:hypothetical protein